MPDDHAISEKDLSDALAISAETLAQRNVKYAVIGGMATGFRSLPRFTKDLNILLSVPQLALPPLLSDLARRGFVFDEAEVIREWTQHHMAVLDYHGIRINLLKPVLPAYLHILDRATTESWLGHPIRVASAEGLILLGFSVFHTQDQLYIEDLVAIHAQRLDLDWIRNEWQTIEPLDHPNMRWLEDLVAGERGRHAGPA